MSRSRVLREPGERFRRRPRWAGRAQPAEAFHVLKRVLLGTPMPTRRLQGEELPKRLALPVFSADPLSSVAYATEQAMIVLLAVSLSGRDLVMPISLATALLLAIVVLSYRQTVRAYSTSGGAYAVARDNLGRVPGLTAAAALLIDYVLTVAVSVSAGVTAITSAYTSLGSLTVGMGLFFVVLLTVINLRGVREAGIAFALPTYGFVVAVYATIVVGLIECAGGCPHATVPAPEHIGPPAAAIGVFVVLHAFASGSTALTGIEAISNGVGAFRRPKGENAAKTLTVMGAIAITLFLGVSLLAVETHAAPSQSVSVLSEVAKAVFPTGALFPGVGFYAVQLLTFAILVLAANSAFQGFPRLASLLAGDDFLPRPFKDLGDRLVYSYGALLLALVSSVLIVAFSADVERLVQLYVVGVFTAFTLSQAGMVQYWRRTRGGSDDGEGQAGGGRWRRSMVINALGAAATGFVTVVVIATKFTHGAWIVIVAMPLIVLALHRLHAHYRSLDARARRGTVSVTPGRVHNTVLLYLERVDAATEEALSYIHYLEEDEVRAIHVTDDPGVGEVRERWRELGDPLELKVLERSGDGPPSEAVIEHLHSIERRDGDFVTVVIPELMKKASLVSAVRRGPSFKLKLDLLSEPSVVITDVPVLDEPEGPPLAAEEIDPEKSAAFVVVSAVDDPAVHAVNYARCLHAFETRALFFALDPESAQSIQTQWDEREIPTPLDVIECPFRELATPLLERLARVTRHENGIAAVVLPELVTGRGWHSFLHNRQALYLKWLLLFEPRVVLSSVPCRV